MYPDDHFGICMIFYLNHDDHIRLLRHMLSRPDWTWQIMVYIPFNPYLLHFIRYNGSQTLHSQEHFEPLTIAWAVRQHRLQWSSTYSFDVVWWDGHRIIHHWYSCTNHFSPLSHQFLLGFGSSDSSSSDDDANLSDASDHWSNWSSIT